ncbi:hypothetical protein FO519_005767 [Halicephalobus sp. NKZ332]|nr:hypothetical protein FO519_005767 [Halicephalobus sp. NKZ332]
MEDQTKDRLNENPESDHDTSKDPIYAARDHDKQFDPVQYLEGFYKTAKEDEAMQIVLFFLPGVLYRLPSMIGNLLDLGAGPTVYIPITVRNRVENVYTSDYAETNRNMLQSWIEDKSDFDWSNVCTWISSIEGTAEKPVIMQGQAREKMRAVLEVNVHKQPVVQGVHYRSPTCTQVPEQFDVITTVFCLEYASETLEEYSRAVRNAISLIKPGGFLVQGGVLNADEYSFGGRRFRCHHLTKDQLLQCLKLMNNRSCNQHACTSFDDTPPPLLFRGFDVNSCYNDLHVDTELSMVNSPCTSISDTTPPPVMDKNSVSLNAMKQLVVEQPVNVNGNGVKVLSVPDDARRKNQFSGAEGDAKAQYSRKRKVSKPAAVENTAGEPREFAGFDDSSASTSNEGTLPMTDQFPNGYDGEDASMLSFAHPMMNQGDGADDSGDIRIDTMSPPTLGRQSVGTENESVAGDPSKKQTLYSTAQKSIQKARQRNLTAFAKRHRSITKKVLLSTRQATIFNGTSHFHRFTKTRNFMATVPSGEMQSVLPRYAENCSVITETNPCTVTGNAFNDESRSQISANDLNSVVSQGFVTVPPTLSDALAITACSWTADMLQASSALYSYSPSSKVGVDESAELSVYHDSMISSAVNESATLVDADDSQMSITEAADNLDMEFMRDVEISVGNEVNTKDRKKGHVNSDEFVDNVVKKGTTFRVRKEDENCYISGMTCMQKPKAEDLSVCTLMLPRPEDEITRPRRKRRKEGYSMDLVKDVVGCFPQRPFFIKGRVCFETVNEETKKVLKFYGKTPETARKLEKNDFACFTGAAWYRAQFREVAVRSRPVMLPPVDAKKERTFDPYKRKLAAKCVYKPIPMPKHIEIPLTPEWTLPMPMDFEEVSQKYTDFLYQEHDLRKPVEYDCHWGEYFVPRETRHQNVSFSESLLRGDTVLVDEYTPLKFDSVPMVENEASAPRPSKSKKSVSKKARKEKLNANRSPVRKYPPEMSESSRTSKYSTPKATNFRLNPASGNSSKPFNSNVFEITPAGSSKPLPIRGALPPEEKTDGYVPEDEPMDYDPGLKEPKTESEDENEPAPESVIANNTNCTKGSETTVDTKKPSLRRSVRKSTGTNKPNGVSESNGATETSATQAVKIETESDDSVSTPKRKTVTNVSSKSSIKEEPLSDGKVNGFPHNEPLIGEAPVQKSRKSSAKPKTTRSASRAESEDNNGTVSESSPTNNGISSKNDPETNAETKSRSSSLRRSVRKSGVTVKSNGMTDTNGTDDTPPTTKVDTEANEAVSATKRKPAPDEDGPLPKKRRSRPVQRYEPPY